MFSWRHRSQCSMTAEISIDLADIRQATRELPLEARAQFVSNWGLPENGQSSFVSAPAGS
jgi:hypothetical protein